MADPCNSWPNRETWLAARWLFSYRYGELVNTSRDLWRTTRRHAHDSRVRHELAGLMREMVVKAGDVVDGLPSWSIEVVRWDRVADHFLGGIPGYRSGRDVP